MTLQIGKGEDVATVERGYQPNFYSLSERVRDLARRQRKAEKIKWLIERYARHLPSGGTCLDVGCSAGAMTVVIAPLFGQMVGLEYDEAALVAVEPAYRAQIDFLRGDAMTLPLPDNSVDAVICAQVYEHVPDDAQLFREIYRVLVPGGLVFFSGPNWLFPIEPHYFLPFLHWLSAQWAARYLRLTGMGSEYYERSRTLWGLRAVTAAFEVDDLSRVVLQQHVLANRPRLAKLVERLPESVWRLLLPWLPNFNWLMYKPLQLGLK
ncbi:MAG: class I SAM-dependent methyltransferase [Caldilineaceae bacterium]|nr:class I SAM-dependent methyltransferase [Caldilineaceae bacterium]